MAELLAPAGNVEALDAAIGEGADAVYLGLKNKNKELTDFLSVFVFFCIGFLFGIRRFKTATTICSIDKNYYTIKACICAQKMFFLLVQKEQSEVICCFKVDRPPFKVLI